MMFVTATSEWRYFVSALTHEKMSPVEVSDAPVTGKSVLDGTASDVLQVRFGRDDFDSQTKMWSELNTRLEKTVTREKTKTKRKLKNTGYMMNWK